MSGVDDKVVTVKKLLEGNYVFKLTVTDDKGLTGTDTVAVNVKKGQFMCTCRHQLKLYIKQKIVTTKEKIPLFAI